MAKSPIKIYVHSNHYLVINRRSFKKAGRIFTATKSFFSLLFAALFFVCYQTGLALIKLAMKIARAAVLEFKRTRLSARERIKKFSPVRFGQAVLPLFFGLVLFLAGFWSLKFAATAFDIKNRLFGQASLAEHYLQQAKNSLGNQDFTKANNSFYLAWQTLNGGQARLSEEQQLIQSLLTVLPQKQDADKVLQAVKLIAAGGAEFTNVATLGKSLKFTPAGLLTQQGDGAGRTVEQITDGLANLSQDLTQAEDILNQVNPKNLPQSYRAQFLGAQGKLSDAALAVNNLNFLFHGLAPLLSGDKTLLIFFENNNELRPTGGFMGTYAALNLSNGRLKKLAVSSVYDLDGQLTDKILPPKPLLVLGPSWHLRDANWFANLPDSAEKISSFYEQEGGQTPDALFFLTPNIVIDWLKITGPIYLNKYGLTLTADNFVELTQMVSTHSDDLPTNSPKQIFADLIPELLNRLSNLNDDEKFAALLAMQNNLNAKQIVAYSRIAETQKVISQLNWGGELKTSDRDYLAIVSSNLSGTKSDLFISQDVSLVSTIGEDGLITDELTIARSNSLPDLPQTNNNSYLRIFVPLGSKLLSNTGFDFTDPIKIEQKDYKVDDDVHNWEQNLVIDNISGTAIGEESGKTYFGNWLNVKGGDSRTVKLVYRLPFKLSDPDRFSLLLQKQPGSLNQNFHWQLNFSGRKIVWKGFDPSELFANNLKLDNNLGQDYFYGLVLEKR